MTNTDTAEKVVAEWRDAMEGVPDGEIERAFIVDGYGEAIQGEAVLYLPDDNEAEFRGAHAEVISAWFERCSPSGISGLLALIESQRATIERQAGEISNLLTCCETMEADCIQWVDRLHAAEARVTALEAEKAGLVKAAQAVEQWWLEEGMKHRTGAPYAIYATRCILHDLSRSSTEVKNDGA